MTGLYKFDANFYLAVNRDLADAGIDPLKHFNEIGWRKGLDPNPFFSTSHYLSANPDVAETGVNPFAHFVQIGHKQDRPFAPSIFDPKFYAREVGQIFEAENDAIEHYWRIGRKRFRSPNPLFDVSFYRSQCPDAESGSFDVLEHYLAVGWQQGLSPHPLFDPKFYEEQLTVEQRSFPSLVHYLMIGWRVGLKPHPLFDPDYYLLYAPPAAQEMCPLVHYLTATQGDAIPHYLFSDAYYIACANLAIHDEPHRQYESGPPLLHYIKFGARRRIRTHPLFDAEHYQSELSKKLVEHDPGADLEALVESRDFLRHYLVVGTKLGVSPSPYFDAAYYRSQFDTEIEGDILRHYLLPENFSCISPHPAFDLDYYAKHAKDFSLYASPSIVHLLATEPNRRVSPHPAFDPVYYRRSNTDIENACPILHFLAIGIHEGRQPNGWFSKAYIHHLYSDRSFSTESAVEFFFSSGFQDRLLVLFIGHEASRTGAPLILLRLIQEFSRIPGVECMTILGRDGELAAEYRRYSHVYVVQESDRLFFLDSEHSEAFQAEVESIIEKSCEGRKVICICNSMESVHIADVIAKAGIRIAGLIHEAADFYFPWLMQKMFNICDQLIVPSEYVLERARFKAPVPASKTVVHPQGLLNGQFGSADRDVAKKHVYEELGLPNSSLVVLACGTVTRRKGADLFVEAATHLLANAGEMSERLRFVWLGGGSSEFESALWWANKRISQLGLEDRILFIGARENPEPYFLAADVFVLTSRFDPFPCVVHEAMACSLPIVAFKDCGGGPEAFRDSGLVVPQDPPQMANAIMRLLKDEKLRKDLGGRARSIVSTEYRFSEYAKKVQATVGKKLDIPILLEPRQVRLSTAKKTRLYFSLSDLKIDGGYLLAEDVVNGMNARGFDAKILCPNGRFTPPRKTTRLENVPRVFIQPDTLDQAQHNLLLRLRDEQDLCVFVSIESNEAGLTAWLPEHVRVVSIATKEDNSYFENAYQFGRYWNRIVTVSGEIGDRICSGNSDFRAKHEVIPYAVHCDAARFEQAVSRRARRTSQDPLRIAFAASKQHDERAIQDCVRLARLLQRNGANFELSFLGDGEDFGAVRDDLIDLLDAGKVCIPFSTSSSELLSGLAEADVFVASSAGRGTTLLNLQAMALGCVPIVLDADDSTSKWIAREQCGFVVSKRNALSMASLLGSLQQDRDRIIAACAKIANALKDQRFNAETMLDRYATLFHGALADSEQSSKTRRRW